MPRSKEVATAPSPAPDLAQAVIALTDQVGRLAEEIRVMRNAIDDALGEFAWAARNDKLGGCRQAHVVQLHSMSAEVNGPDWNEKLNSHRRTAPTAEAGKQTTEVPPSDGRLW